MKKNLLFLVVLLLMGTCTVLTAATPSSAKIKAACVGNTHYLVA